MCFCAPSTHFTFSHTKRVFIGGWGVGKNWETIVQSSAFPTVFHTDENVSLEAPTGAGKTVVLELAVLRQMNKQQSPDGRFGMVVYLSPTKALCAEKRREWVEKFSSEPCGLRISLLTSDTDFASYDRLKRADIIIATPEKWDSMTRRWKEHKALMENITLMFLDEVHLLGESRGATLEAIVSRMKVMQKHLSTSIRFIAISATIPNVSDVGAWLNAKVMKFGEEYRPVPIEKHVETFPSRKNGFLFDRNLNYCLFRTIAKYFTERGVLVFCSTRKGTVDAARQLVMDSRQRNMFIRSMDQRSDLETAARTIENRSLSECVAHGVGFYHAGLNFSDRSKVISLFTNGALLVCCCTSSLALGVNLPARCVIIKGTQRYVHGKGYEEYSGLEVHQMIGRAGRPQYDDQGDAVIMTSEGMHNYYIRLLDGLRLVESTLLDNLMEHLNAEVVLGTVTSIQTAFEWIKSTFFYVRAQQAPNHYFGSGAGAKEPLDVKLRRRLAEYIEKLVEHGFAKLDENDGCLSPLDPGMILAKFYLFFDTAVEMQNVSRSDDVKSVLSTLAKAKEMNSLAVLRRGEKRLLNDANKRIRYPISGRVKTSEDKINVLVQTVLGNQPIESAGGMSGESVVLMREGSRLCGAMIEFMKHMNYLKPLVACVNLRKSLKAKIWHDGELISAQLEGVGPKFARILAENHLVTIDALRRQSSVTFETLLNRRPPFGSRLMASLDKFPSYTMDVSQDVQEEGVAEICVTVRRVLPKHVSSGTSTMMYFVAGNSVGELMCCVSFSSLKETNTFKFLAERRGNSLLDIRVVGKEIIGIDASTSILPIYGDAFDEDPTRFHEAPNPFEGVERSTNAAVVDTSDYVPCLHTCKDKTACKHECCKIGIPRSKAARRKKRKHKEHPSISHALEHTKQATLRYLQSTHHSMRAPRKQRREYIDLINVDEYHSNHVFGDEGQTRLPSQPPRPSSPLSSGALWTDAFPHHPRENAALKRQVDQPPPRAPAKPKLKYLSGRWSLLSGLLEEEQ